MCGGKEGGGTAGRTGGELVGGRDRVRVEDTDKGEGATVITIFHRVTGRRI